MFTAAELLDMAIKVENNGEAAYRSAIAKVKSPELVCLLKWMADEEVEHARFFSELKHNLETKGRNPFVEEMSRELFDDLLGNQNFSLKEVDFSVIDNSDAMIDVFIEFEKDSVIFYTVLEPFVEDPVALEHLQKIIDEENHHIRKLQKFIGSNEVCGIIDK